MFKELFDWLGRIWVGEMLEELEQVAATARRKGDLCVIEGASAQRDARELDVQRALRNRSSLLLSMSDFGKYTCTKAVAKAEACYGQVIGSLFYVMKWRSPIYSQPAAKASLKKLIAASARSMDGYKYSLLTMQEWLSFLEQLIEEWGKTPLDMKVIEPDPAKALRYRGTVYYSEIAVSSQMIDDAWRVVRYAGIVDTIATSLRAEGERNAAASAREALIAGERALNGAYAHQLRQLAGYFFRAYLTASEFWKLEQSAGILPEAVEPVRAARAELCDAMRRACNGMRQCYQAQLEQAAKAKAQFELASQLL